MVARLQLALHTSRTNLNHPLQSKEFVTPMLHLSNAMASKLHAKLHFPKVAARDGRDEGLRTSSEDPGVEGKDLEEDFKISTAP